MPQYKHVLFAFAVTAATAFPATQASAQAHGGHDHGGDSSAATTQQSEVGDPYLLSTDPVTGEPLGDEPVVYEHEGRELRFANEENLQSFKEHPQQYLGKLDEKMIENQLPLYPLDTCPITGEALGSMGEPINVIHNNRLIRLCCAGCKGQLEAKAEEVFAKLDAAVAEQQKPTEPMKTCPVSGDEMGSMGDPVTYVAGNRLFSFCCKGCIGMFEKNPAKYLEKMNNGGGATTKPAADGAQDAHSGHSH